jgi:enamine deaminase RidA (YjgF/YER057c/UK114 family)
VGITAGVINVPSSAHLGHVQSPESRLIELGIDLPEPPQPLGPYPAVRIVGDLLYTTAVLPMWNGELRYEGALGSQVGLADGAAAARLCGLNLLALIRAHAGSLDNVRQVTQIVGLVNSAPAFAQQSKVMNGLSELLYEVFGEAGRHGRTALATTDLPRNATVQATAVVRMVTAAVAAGDSAETGVPVAGTPLGGALDEVPNVPVSGAPVVRERVAGAKATE